MFIRKRTVHSTRADHEYLQLVESQREGKHVRQKVIANLGRCDQLVGDGTLDRLIESLARFSERLSVIDALRDGDIIIEDCPEWGPSLVFGRLWDDLGLREYLQAQARERRFEFDVERVSFAIALQRLVRRNTGSDRDGLEWLKHCRIDGLSDGYRGPVVDLQHFYRTVSFLAENKEGIERHLWARGRTLFNYQVDLALFDTTSAYFEGEGPEGLAALGKSKDGKHDCTQVVIGVVLTQDGWPLCSEVWPGNTSDMTTVVPILRSLEQRFQLRKVVFVSDRGMTSKANLQAIRDAHYDYIVGCKLRGDKTVREQVLSRPGRYHDVEDNLRVKEVEVDGCRYIVCHNPFEEERDRRDREKILAALREKVVGQSAKKLTANRGYKRFLSKPPSGTLTIDEEKVKADARFDGKYVLRTSTDWSPAEVAKSYKTLWMVERFFRDLKGLVTTRPIFHHKQANVRGHITGSFLSMYLAVAMRKKIDGLKLPSPPEWEHLMSDLKSVRAVELELSGRQYLARTELHGHAHVGFRAAGMRPPPRVRLHPSGGTEV